MFNFKRGIIGPIIVIIIAIVLLRVWLGFDIFKWLGTPEVKAVLLKIWGFIVVIWNNYVKDSFISFVDFMKSFGK